MMCAKDALRVAVVGPGHRGILYASYALKHPDEMKITAVVDPQAHRRESLAAKHGLGPEACFESVEQFAAANAPAGASGAAVGGGARPPGRLADAAINATMDSLHVPTTVPLLEAGLDVLMEKPLCTRAEDVSRLLDAARAGGRTVLVCHVLRYAPFYAAIRQRVARGEIGDIVSVQTAENVSYHHMAIGFVRGKWSRRDVGGSSMLMAKCCHDLDLIAWMKSGVSPRAVTSLGGLMQYRPQNAPAGSGTRCMVDCRIEASCPYSARRLHVDHDYWAFYTWEGIEHVAATPTREQKIASLKSDNPFGRCVWRCDNDVVDHQSVLVQFADGCVATHTMTGGTARPCRSMHLVGTRGEIQGVMEEGRFVVRTPDPDAAGGYRQETVETNVSGDAHGGCDLLLVADFLRVLRGQTPSLSTTCLTDSIHGARIGFAADESMEQRKPVELPLP